MISFKGGGESNCHMFVSSDLRLWLQPPRMAAKCAHQGFQPDLTPLLFHGRGSECVRGRAVGSLG